MDRQLPGKQHQGKTELDAESQQNIYLGGGPTKNRGDDLNYR